MQFSIYLLRRAAFRNSKLHTYTLSFWLTMLLGLLSWCTLTYTNTTRSPRRHKMNYALLLYQIYLSSSGNAKENRKKEKKTILNHKPKPPWIQATLSTIHTLHHSITIENYIFVFWNVTNSIFSFFFYLPGFFTGWIHHWAWPKRK